MVMASFVYFPNLVDIVMHYLNLYDECGKLHWHDGAIPGNQVWVKLGGDHGGGSFKFVLEIANVERPNSVNNTIPLCVFDCQDTASNLHLALSMYADQVKALQETEWRGKRIVVFAFGDYEYQTKMYGLSGASGLRPCLHCHIVKKDMEIAPQSRAASSSNRSLASLLHDHNKYSQDGSILSRAKLFNNVIRPCILPIPITHVAIPSLHLDLGIFPWLFNAFEADLHCLDTKAAACSGAQATDSEAFQQLAELHSRLVDVEGELQNCSARIQASEQQLQYLALFSGLGEVYEIAAKHIQDQIQGLIQEKQVHTDQQQELEVQIQDKRKGAGGPCKASIEPVLQELRIERQAYHGGAFIGNHVHTALQPNAIKTIVEAPTKIVQQRYPTLLVDAQDVETRYRQLFQGYSECRKLFSHCKKLSQSDITALETCIKEFLGRCRTEVVARKLGHITPKLHLLEDHVIPFARRFEVGLGLLAEQGSESIHARFNTLARNYHAMPNELQRLTAISQQHLVSVLPQLDDLRPATTAKQRK